jgi:SAM-dependent methyltransferase
VAGADWEERISRDTNPAIRIEHETRYRMAVPVIRDAPVWCDLGCGSGIAAAAALGEPFAGHAVLVDVAADVLRHAEREIEAARTVIVVADLTAEADLRRVRDAVLDEDGAGGCVTCFEVVEHLANFVPLVEMLVELAERHRFTVALSVPNDAFWSIKNPFHHTMWGDGAFEELRRLLPGEHVVAQQIALRGSLARVDGDDSGRYAIELESPDSAVPTHFLVAMGPGATRLTSAAAVAGADLVEQRRWERQRESDLAHLLATERWLRSELEDWRRYIHELEGRLGLPLSGTGDQGAG